MNSAIHNIYRSFLPSYLLLQIYKERVEAKQRKQMKLIEIYLCGSLEN